MTPSPAPRTFSLASARSPRRSDLEMHLDNAATNAVLHVPGKQGPAAPVYRDGVSVARATAIDAGTSLAGSLGHRRDGGVDIEGVLERTRMVLLTPPVATTPRDRALEVQARARVAGQFLGWLGNLCGGEAGEAMKEQGALVSQAAKGLFREAGSDPSVLTAPRSFADFFEDHPDDALQKRTDALIQVCETAAKALVPAS